MKTVLQVVYIDLLLLLCIDSNSHPELYLGAKKTKLFEEAQLKLCLGLLLKLIKVISQYQKRFVFYKIRQNKIEAFFCVIKTFFGGFEVEVLDICLVKEAFQVL